jgi:hypothetical protein
MIRPDERVARCLIMLRDPQFSPLIEYWRLQRAETVNTLVKLTDVPHIHRHQGSIEKLDEMLQAVEQSEALYKKMKNF